ncbi:hypothetical protein G6F42_022520 [Rhizopus arrhizus]|nr:hypothetical protein G6F42_022520 [Rhizopus arrhizus]
MVLGTFYLVLTRRYFYSACLVFGLSVHFKIYPVIYAIPLLMLLDDHYGNPFQQSSFLVRVQHVRFRIINDLDQQLAEKDSTTTKIMRGIIVFLSPVRILFGFISAFVFFALTASMYQQYGDEFMQHTYLYHVTREDHRHNFSIWFYQMYLGIDNTSPWMGLVAFVPQLALVTIIGIAFGKDLFFATFVQTFIFVTFNKVITSQYFMWYICLFPLILPSSKMKFKWKGLLLLLAWVAGQGLWLNFAYQLEFLGQNTFLQLWIAGVTFFIVNCWIVVELILNHQYEPIYGSSGRIRWVWGNGDPGSRRSL